MALIFDDPDLGPETARPVSFKLKFATTEVDQGLAGTIRLSPQVNRQIELSQDLSIFAPSEMGEAFAAGSSEPLKQLVRSCTGRDF